MPTDHHKFHFHKDKKRKSIQETTIEQLLQQIESEVQKTDEQTNLQSLKFYSDELDQFTSDIPTCNQKRKEKILDQIKKQNPFITSCPSTNIKEPKPKKSKGKNPIKGENVETAINVSIEEAFFGGSKKISLRAIDRKNENFYNKNSSRY